MKLLTSHRKLGAESQVRVRLILVEENATAFEPPPISENDSDASPEVVVVMQSRGEAKADFVGRALRRVASLERADRSVTEAIIAAGPSRDEATLAARTLNARCLLAHMRRTGQGQIVLMSGGHDGHEARHELLALAGTLTAEAGTAVSVRVLFDSPTPEPERKSGIQALLGGVRRAHDELGEALTAS